MGLRFDYTDGDYCTDMGSGMIMDNEGHIMQDLGSGMSMDMSSGEMHLVDHHYDYFDNSNNAFDYEDDW